MRFINDDVELVCDRRTAPYFDSAHSLVRKINELATTYRHTSLVNITNTPMNSADEIMHRRLRAIMRNDHTIKMDNHFGVGIENFLCNDYQMNIKDIGSNLLGLRRFDNGLVFYGFIAGEDSQRGVFMIVYDDDENLRLYTPRFGNKLNLNRNEPLMCDHRSERYMAKYGLNKTTLGFNWHAMKIDILANFSVDYSNVVRSHMRNVEKGND